MRNYQFILPITLCLLAVGCGVDFGDIDDTDDNNTDSEDFASAESTLVSSPDLRPSPVTGPTSFRVRTTQTWTSYALNYGSVGAGAFKAKWYITNTNNVWIKDIYEASFTSIAANVTTQQAAYKSWGAYTFQNAGSYKIAFRIDSSNQITESLEGNNIWYYSVTVNP